jgi:hypothetical protein
MSGVKHLTGRCQHCGGQLEFRADTIGQHAPCPHCGQMTELMLEAAPVEPTVPRRWLVMTAVAVVVLVGALVACMALLKHFENELARRKEKAAAASSQTSAPPATAQQPEAMAPSGKP